MRTELRAEQIGAAAKDDLQFTVPYRPSLRLGVRMRASGDLVVLDGSDRAQAFTGSSALRCLVPIAELCDGSRTHAQIAETLGLDAPSVSACLALMWTAGTIEEAAAMPPGTTDSPEAVFFSRLGNATGVNASWTDAVAKLRTATVAFMGDPELIQAMHSLLADTVQVTQDSKTATLTVFFETATTTAFKRLQAERFRGPLLRIRADTERIVIGPYVDRVLTPCLSCGSQDDDPISGPISAESHDLAIGLSAHHVVSLIARTTLSHLPGDVSAIELPDLTTSIRPVVTLPGCPECSFSTSTVIAKAPIGARYEASVALPPRAFLSPRDHQAHYYTGNQELQSQFRTWPSRTRVPLPPLQLGLQSREAAGPDTGALDVELLGEILGIAFGINQEASNKQRIKRWTASGGNIGCTTAYALLRNKDIIGQMGVYAYAAEAHALVLISEDVPLGESPCELVITGNLQKIMSKYGSFGLRLAFLDAGCNLASARAVAVHLGVRFQICSTWRDQELARALGINMRTEPIAAVATLGGVTNEN